MDNDRLKPDCLGPLDPWDDTRLPDLLADMCYEGTNETLPPPIPDRERETLHRPP